MTDQWTQPDGYASVDTRRWIQADGYRSTRQQDCSPDPKCDAGFEPFCPHDKVAGAHASDYPSKWALAWRKFSATRCPFLVVAVGSHGNLSFAPLSFKFEFDTLLCNALCFLPHTPRRPRNSNDSRGLACNGREELAGPYVRHIGVHRKGCGKDGEGGG